jgi:hypothetical protein
MLQAAEGAVHQPLECTPCVSQAKWHSSKLKEAERRRNLRFSMSAACMGIWKYPLRKSILLNTEQPFVLAEKSIIFGKG